MTARKMYTAEFKREAVSLVHSTGKVKAMDWPSFVNEAD